MKLLTQNSKIKKTSKHLNVRLFNFGITAYRSLSGKVTCPFAGACAKYCYAQKGAYSWGNVKPAYEKRYELTKQDNFVQLMSEAIVRNKVQYLRVHDSGDYYSPEYLQKWFKIAKLHPNVRFYSYTNSLPLVRNANVPDNFDFIYSDGGKLSHTIDTDNERHSKVFKSLDDLNSAGYVDAHEIDLYATKWFSPKNHKVGLIYH